MLKFLHISRILLFARGRGILYISPVKKYFLIFSNIFFYFRIYFYLRINKQLKTKNNGKESNTNKERNRRDLCTSY